jgi:hypothetical protein
MSNRRTLFLFLTAFLGAVLADTSVAQKPVSNSGATKGAAQPEYLRGQGALTSKQRGQMARDFVLKWGPYFQQTYRQPIGRWAIKQARIFGTADADNLRDAMRKTTLEAATLAMRGQSMTDAETAVFISQKGMIKPRALGDLAADLVFTPLPPCRIFDTRSVGGEHGSGVTRSYDTYPFGSNTNFAYQGGSASSNCGVSPDAAAVVINIAAPLSSVGGFLTVFPFGTARPFASNLDYNAGELKNNEIIATSANSTFDISVYAHGQTHVAADVVGYFIRPGATALQCVETPNTDLSISASGGTGNAVAPACAAGYTQTATNCETTSWLMPIVYFQSGTCSARNGDSNPQTLRASRTCCRVPGR